jgi:iron complex transport system substrate-binding protein
VLSLAASGGAAAEGGGPVPAPPARVVSMNLCTDQLALLLAAPGQLVSVSHLSHDPRGSAMTEAARAVPANHGRAEEIYLLAPDLVVAGTFSSRASVDMLRRLGVPVAVFAPAASLEDVAARLEEMGAALGREEEAARLRAAYEARLAELRAEAPEGGRPRAALYGAHGYTSGGRTLAGQILVAAGFANLADALGYAWGGLLPLEVLALSDPDAVVTGRPHRGAARAEEVLDHPVLRRLREGRIRGTVTDADWVCGTPHVLRAAERLAAARRADRTAGLRADRRPERPAGPSAGDRAARP